MAGKLRCQPNGLLVIEMIEQTMSTRTHFRQVTLAMILGLLCGGAVLSAAEVQRLRCEYRADPLGVDDLAPRLSWIITSDRRGETQTGYRVLVASAPDLLGRTGRFLWTAAGSLQTGSTWSPTMASRFSRQRNATGKC